MATYVRDRKPKTLEEATGLADDFVVNRGWTYVLLLRQICLPIKESSTERKTGLVILEKRYPKQMDGKKIPQPQDAEGSGWRGDQGWKGLPKFDNPDITIMVILHLSVMEKRRRASTRLETINMADLLTPRPEVDLVTTEVNQWTLVVGTVNDQPVERVLLDTGDRQPDNSR